MSSVGTNRVGAESIERWTNEKRERILPALSLKVQLRLIWSSWILISLFPLFSGFSYVDLVEGAKDGHFYALKRILCHDREGRQEAQTEVEMHQIFNHPNVLSLVAHTFVDRGGKTEAWLLLPYIRVSWCRSWYDQNNPEGNDLILIFWSLNRKAVCGLFWRS